MNMMLSVSTKGTFEEKEPTENTGYEPETLENVLEVTITSSRQVFPQELKTPKQQHWAAR